MFFFCILMNLQIITSVRNSFFTFSYSQCQWWNFRHRFWRNTRKLFKYLYAYWWNLIFNGFHFSCFIIFLVNESKKFNGLSFQSNKFRSQYSENSVMATMTCIYFCLNEKERYNASYLIYAFLAILYLLKIDLFNLQRFLATSG